ncbi:hypothetical protein DENSPDRAFT_853942 [Dentipellis sp. KUC8613]|nr:hypothetical protein DENSPDRAFT_853942 [Dentipellis sp. KUC8613]
MSQFTSSSPPSLRTSANPSPYQYALSHSNVDRGSPSTLAEALGTTSYIRKEQPRFASKAQAAFAKRAHDEMEDIHAICVQGKREIEDANRALRALTTTAQECIDVERKSAKHAMALERRLKEYEQRAGAYTVEVAHGIRKLKKDINEARNDLYEDKQGIDHKVSIASFCAGVDKIEEDSRTYGRIVDEGSQHVNELGRQKPIVRPTKDLHTMHITLIKTHEIEPTGFSPTANLSPYRHALSHSDANEGYPSTSAKVLGAASYIRKEQQPFASKAQAAFARRAHDEMEEILAFCAQGKRGVDEANLAFGRLTIAAKESIDLDRRYIQYTKTLVEDTDGFGQGIDALIGDVDNIARGFRAYVQDISQTKQDVYEDKRDQHELKLGIDQLAQYSGQYCRQVDSAVAGVREFEDGVKAYGEVVTEGGRYVSDYGRQVNAYRESQRELRRSRR